MPQKGGTGECPSGFDELSEEEQESQVEEDPAILHCLCADRDVSVLELTPGDVCYDYASVSVHVLVVWLVSIEGLNTALGGEEAAFVVLRAFDAFSCAWFVPQFPFLHMFHLLFRALS